MPLKTPEVQSADHTSQLSRPLQRRIKGSSSWPIPLDAKRPNSELFRIRLDSRSDLFQITDIELIKKVLRGRRLDVIGPGESEPWLHQAIKRNHHDLIAELIAAGANLESSSLSGWRPLHEAIRARMTTWVYTLLKLGVNCEASNNNHWTPMHVAAQCGSSRVMELLMDAGATLDPQTSAGRTPLHIAVEGKNMGCVRWLMLQGVSIQPQDYDGDTPLHLAIESLHHPSIECLLLAGANPDLPNKKNKTAWQCAPARREQEIRMLYERLLFESEALGRGSPSQKMRL